MVIDTTRRSPNYSSRNGHAVRLAVLHATVGGLESSLNWLCNPESKVSAHYVVSRDGRIFGLVDEHRAAWHAGKSAWRDLDSAGIMTASIGVELENRTGMTGFVGQDPYPPAQLYALTWLALDIRSRCESLVWARHLDIATPKGRKSDPAGFPWGAWLARITPGMSAPAQPAATHRAPVLAWVRTAPNVRSARKAVLPAGSVVTVVRVVAGEARNGSDQWAELASGGYVWLPQLEAL